MTSSIWSARFPAPTTLPRSSDEFLTAQPVAERLRQQCELRDVERYLLEPPSARVALGVRIHRDQKSGRDEARQRHHGQCRQDIGTQGACEQIAHFPLPTPRPRDVEYDQLGEIGEVRSHPFEPLPDAADDGNDLRPGIGRVRDLHAFIDREAFVRRRADDVAAQAFEGLLSMGFASGAGVEGEPRELSDAGIVGRRAGADGAKRQGFAPGVGAGGDAVVDGGAAELPEQRYHDIQRSLQETSPYVVMFQQTEQVVRRKNVQVFVSGSNFGLVFYRNVIK